MLLASPFSCPAMRVFPFGFYPARKGRPVRGHRRAEIRMSRQFEINLAAKGVDA